VRNNSGFKKLLLKACAVKAACPRLKENKKKGCHVMLLSTCEACFTYSCGGIASLLAVYGGYKYE